MSNYNENNIKIYTAGISNEISNKNISSNIILNKNNIKQIELRDNINKPDYSDANIIKFLTFLNNSICIPDNLRIVCHSHIMQGFLNKLDIDVDNNLKTILKENLWTLFLNLNENKKISISRHGFSNANLIKEKKKTLLGKLEQILEKDATLTVYGILTALLHSDELNLKEKNSGLTDSPNTIFVSVLIRTWMTAICLYLPQCETDNFKLIISPFIKEKGFGLDNQPESFDNQILNLKNFLNYLILISDVSLSKELMNKNLNIIKTFFRKGNSLTIYGEKEVKYILLNDSIKYEIISNNNNFFDKKCVEKDNFQIENINIFHGYTKPIKNSMDTLFTRWCEPFSQKKGNSNSIEKCKKRLNESILKPRNTITNYNNNNNNIGEFREAIIERPNNINNLLTNK